MARRGIKPVIILSLLQCGVKMFKETRKKLFVMQDSVPLYERDLINMVSRNGVEISFDINTAGVF